MKNITASHFYQYSRCPASVYLDFHGDESKKRPISEFLLKKFEDGRILEDDVVKDLDFEPFSYSNYQEGFEKTVDMMKSGVDLIRHGVLIDGDFVGIPDLLEKRPGKSSLGNYYYVPCDIKSGHSLKPEYEMQVTFYAYLLDLVQGRMPDEGEIILWDESKESFSVPECLDRFNEIMEDIKEIVAGKVVKPHICSNCGECIWGDYCLEIAIENDDLSLISGLGSKKRKDFTSRGICKSSDVATMDIEKMCEVKGLGVKSLTNFKNQAISLKEDRVIKLGTPKFPESKTEIFFDIEGETNLGIDYLYGLWVREDSNERFECFLAERPEDEGKMWKSFLDFMSGIDDFTIYYYTSYEKTSMKKLFERHGGDEDTLNEIRENMIDLYPIVRNSVVLPLYSYSLKPIAKYLGHSWSSTKAGGAQSIYWYSVWLETGDKKILDTIIEYNKEDCIATRVLKDWLGEL